MFSGKLELTRLEDDLHLLAGAGGNILIAGSADHLLVIDSGMPHRAAEVLAHTEKLFPSARRKSMVNTHWHFDHTGGNAPFAAAGYSILANTATRTRLGQRINFEDFGMVIEPAPEAAWPIATFDDRLTLHALQPVTFTKIKPAHTDTDIVAHFEKYNILHTGDLLFAGTFPVIDRATGGSLDGFIAAAKTLLDMTDDKTRVVPGHGPLSTKATLTAQYDLLRLVRDRLAPLADKKLSLQEAVDQKPLADLDDQWGRGMIRSPLFTRMAYGQWVK
jgi:glyoxylase-like metal-dependent hydrolase (beta-lactamase superfamily II)